MSVNFADRKILIAGKGVSGTGAYEALVHKGAVCAFYGEAPEDFSAELLVVSPGIDLSQPLFTYAHDCGIPVIGELELGYLLCDKPIIAVTGTNGKTTVTTLLGEMMRAAGVRAAVCGNVGSSFALRAAAGDYDVAVVECSSFQLETVSEFRPHIAVITNISPDHLNRHKTMAAYCAAKHKIALRQTADDYLILSQDDIPLYALENLIPHAQTFYTSVRGVLRGAYVSEGNIYFNGEYICETDRVRMEGEHNLKNALSAVCAAKLYGIKNEFIVSALTSFTSDAHRIKLVARRNGKNYYDDSKGTNIMASVRAAQCMCGDTCMIVGGSDKGYEYDGLFENLPPTVVRIAAVGATAQKVTEAAARHGFADIEKFGSFSDAFHWAADGAEENVLLSPASASFDMFSSYAERGDEFERLVKSIDER